MEYMILALLLLIVVLLLLLLLRQQRDAESRQKAAQVQEREARTEISEIIQRTVQGLGEILAANQERLGQAQVAQLRQMEMRLKTFELSNEQKLDGVRETMSKRLRYLQEDNNRQLEEIRVTVDEKLQKTLEEKMTHSFRLVSQRLEEVYKGLGEMQTLAAGVGDLKKVLSNVKTRGILGELQLGAILREILAPEQYETEYAVSPDCRNRVEFAIRLPGENGIPVYLPIDSKFPGDAYQQLQAAYEAGEPETIKAALQVLKARIRSFAKDIHDKYIVPPYTTSFAVMFLPFEGLYAEVVNSGLVEELQQTYQVSIAGPSTMAALLNSLQMGFHTLAIQRRSHEVWRILGAVKTEFARFEETLTAAQKRMQQVSGDLDKLVGVRTRAINRSLREVEALETQGLLETDERLT